MIYPTLLSQLILIFCISDSPPEPTAAELRMVRDILGTSWTALEQAEAFSFSVVTWVELEESSEHSMAFQRIAQRSRESTFARYELAFAQPNRFRWSLTHGGLAERTKQQWEEMGIDEMEGANAMKWLIDETAAPTALAVSDGEALTVVRLNRYAEVPAPDHLAEALSPRLWAGRHGDFNPLRQALGLLYRAQGGLAGGQMPEYIGREFLGGREVIRIQGPLGLLRIDPRAPRDTPTRVIVWLQAEAPHLPVRMHVLSAEKSPETQQAMKQHLPPHIDDWMRELAFASATRVIEFRDWNLDVDPTEMDSGLTLTDDMKRVDSIRNLLVRDDADLQRVRERAFQLLDAQRGRPSGSDDDEPATPESRDEKIGRGGPPGDSTEGKMSASDHQ